MTGQVLTALGLFAFPFVLALVAALVDLRRARRKIVGREALRTQPEVFSSPGPRTVRIIPKDAA